MPEPGATILINGIKARVNGDGEWTPAPPPDDKPDEECTKVERIARMLARASNNYEYSPGDGDPSTAYAEHAIEYLGTGKLVSFTQSPAVPGELE